MKKSQEIIGLPVFSVLDGKKIGQVKDLLLNPEEGKLDFILVSNGSWYSGARVLPYKAVMGIGQHAVTTESDTSMTNISETASAHSLLQRNIEIKGNRVLTNRGNLIGIVIEYELDEITGKVTRLEYRTAQDESVVEIIDAGQVLTYGMDVIVIKEDAVGGSPIGPDNSEEEVTLQSVESVKPADTIVVSAPPAPVEAPSEIQVSNVSPQPEPARPVVPPPVPQSVIPAPVREELPEADFTPAGGGDGAAFFKQRQRQFLLGKKLVQDIRDASGNLLIPEGTVVSEKIIDLAEKHNKYVELTQCVK
ncbi:MAG: photosystem reaction center subunit H [Syntrophomonadaceae bacterium]|nr:photosystem reaction center subunit H [Syntrophomonadaceae bacterium]